MGPPCPHAVVQSLHNLKMANAASEHESRGPCSASASTISRNMSRSKLWSFWAAAACSAETSEKSRCCPSFFFRIEMDFLSRPNFSACLASISVIISAWRLTWSQPPDFNGFQRFLSSSLSPSIVLQRPWCHAGVEERNTVGQLWSAGNAGNLWAFPSDWPLEHTGTHWNCWEHWISVDSLQHHPCNKTPSLIHVSRENRQWHSHVAKGKSGPTNRISRHHLRMLRLNYSSMWSLHVTSCHSVIMSCSCPRHAKLHTVNLHRKSMKTGSPGSLQDTNT